MNERIRGVPDHQARESDAAELPIEGVRAFTAAAFTAAGESLLQFRKTTCRLAGTGARRSTGEAGPLRAVR